MTRKVTLISILLLLCNLAFSQGKVKQYEKIIKKYDITYLLYSTQGSAEDYWRQLENGHKGLQEYNRAVQKGQRLARLAEQDINEAMGLVNTQYKSLYVYNDEQTIEFTNAVETSIMGFDADRVRIHIAYGKVPNAFCTPYGDIYIYSSLLGNIDSDWRMLFGVCAHEVAHYYLKHSARQQWADRKRQRKNRIVSGLAIAMTAAAETYAAYKSGYAGSRYEPHIAEICHAILACARYDNQLYHFKYSREEELEADIIAYRFLEYIGVDPNCYIQALESLGTEGDAFYDSWSDHPTIGYRTNFLRYLGERYPLHE